MIVESLPVLVLNPHSRCNCRCIMCDIWKDTSVRNITPEELERHLASIEHLRVQWVVFSGGEPLMHSNLWRLTSMLRDRKIRITLLSSGLLLSRHAANIVEHVDDLIVSLDGPPEVHNRIRGMARAFELLAEGVRGIHALHPGFEIAGRCTVQRSNFSHLPATVECARELDLKSISFLAADLRSSAFNRPAGWNAERQAEVGLGAEDLTALESGIEELISRKECGNFVRETPLKLRRILQHFRCHLRGENAEAPACNAPWTSAVIEADGAVRPCFFHQPIGYLGSGKSLEEILNGPEAIAFRQNLQVATNPVCRNCVCSLNWKGTTSKPHTHEVIF